jgi:hypothetical protein
MRVAVIAYDGFRCDSYLPTATALQVPQLNAISARVHIDTVGFVFPLQCVHANSSNQHQFATAAVVVSRHKVYSAYIIMCDCSECKLYTSYYMNTQDNPV